jgi:hypothetical protein
VEPPGPDVPDHRDPDDPLGPLRLSAALGAATLALAGAGHLFVLGGLVALVGRSRAGAAAALLAVTAVLVRWSGPSLAAAAGNQAVLGPAVVVGSTAAAVSSLLAATAVVLLAPRPPVLAVAVGIVAGAIAAGPELPHELGVRAAGIAVGVAAALVARWVPLRHPAAAALAALALVLAAA